MMHAGRAVGSKVVPLEMACGVSLLALHFRSSLDLRFAPQLTTGLRSSRPLFKLLAQYSPPVLLAHFVRDPRGIGSWSVE
jgi:hypothetical protein